MTAVGSLTGRRNKPMNVGEVVLEVVKVLAGFVGGGLTGWWGARTQWIKTKAEVAETTRVAEQKVKRETLEQSITFNDRLLQYQDNIRLEVLTAYTHLNDCHENEAMQAAHIRYLEERCEIPQEQRYKRIERPKPIVSEFLRTPLPKKCEEFIRRTNEQDSKVLHKALETKKEELEDLNRSTGGDS
jgi:hypothetical protein